MRRTLALATAGLLCGMTVSACSDDEPAASPTVSSSPSSPSSPATATPSQPTEPTEPTKSAPSADPTKPVLPGLAKEHTQGGAKAFITYYVTVLNDAHKSESTALLRSHSDKRCTICGILADAVDETRRNGGYQRGGDWSVLRVLPLPSDQPSSPQFITEVEMAAGTSQSASDAPVDKIKSRRLFIEVQLVWDSAWRIRDMRLG